MGKFDELTLQRLSRGLVIDLTVDCGDSLSGN